MQPILIWLLGIAALATLLIVRWDFAPPITVIAISVMVGGMLAGYFAFSRPRPNDARIDNPTPDPAKAATPPQADEKPWRN